MSAICQSLCYVLGIPNRRNWGSSPQGTGRLEQGFSVCSWTNSISIPGNLLKVQILVRHPRATKSETGGGGQHAGFTRLPGDSDKI